ncbi:twin-arginine translocation signal domain-containing protein [Shigella flexneri]
MKLSRRSFMKANAVAAAAAAAGSACRALPAPLLVSRKPLNGIKRRAVSAVLVGRSGRNAAGACGGLSGRPGRAGPSA